MGNFILSQPRKPMSDGGKFCPLRCRMRSAIWRAKEKFKMAINAVQFRKHNSRTLFVPFC
jgi:hypothetical protein